MPSMDELGEIRAVFERCQRHYPTVDLPFELFCARVVEILTAGHGTHAAGEAGRNPAGSFHACSDCFSLLRQMCHEDLFLAVACARGDRIAWEHFADQYLPLLKRFAAQACRNCDAGEDLAHELVTVLLGESHAATQTAGQGDEPEPASGVSKGKLQSYNGRGSLAGWLRAAVTHAAIDRFRRARKQVSLDELEENAGLPCAPNPGLANAAEERLDARWGPVLAACVRKEIERLSARDRLILGLYHLEGISLKAIGLRFGAHEATVSRWLERARREIRKHVERELRQVHGLNARELGSLWRWVAESADLMLESALKPASAGIPIQKKLQGGTI